MSILVTVPVYEHPGILYAFFAVKRFIQIFSVIVPVVLIVMATIDIFKQVLSSESDFKTALTSVSKRIVSALMFLLVPTLVLTILSILSTRLTLEFNKCYSNADNYEYFKARYEELKAEENGSSSGTPAPIPIPEPTNPEPSSPEPSDPEPTDSGPIVGQSYDLTDFQIKVLAYMCEKEQGSVEGAKATASVMANLFELKGSTKYGTGGQGLYNYVLRDGWFSSARHAEENYKSAKSSYIAAVKSVLVNGNRTLPFYINEFDCWNCNKTNRCDDGKKGDICALKVDGKTITSASKIKDRSNYITDKTIIYSVYDDNRYTFYTFPASNSDPFGYTESAKRKYDELNK